MEIAVFLSQFLFRLVQSSMKSLGCIATAKITIAAVWIYSVPWLRPKDSNEKSSCRIRTRNCSNEQETVVMNKVHNQPYY